jgi:hypothetical protein
MAALTRGPVRTVAAGALALVLGLAPAAAAAETLGLDPGTARAGSEIAVRDDAFTDPDDTKLDLPAACTISLDGEEVSDLCEVNSDGELRGTFSVPEDMADGEYEVEAVAEDVSATAKLTVSADAPEQAAEQPERRVISTPVGPSDESGKTPLYVVVMVGVATLGVILFRQWRSKNPVDPLTGGPVSYRPATGKAKIPKAPRPEPGENKPPPPKLNIPPPPKAGSGKAGSGKKDGGAAAAGAAAAPAGPANLRLLSRPDTAAQVVLVDLDES